MQLSSRVFALMSTILTLNVSANNLEGEIDLLKKQLEQIQKRILELERQHSENKLLKTKSDDLSKERKHVSNARFVKEVSVYASLRPTLGLINDSKHTFWDVRDALSNAGIKSTYEFEPKWKAILHGEWGIDLSNNGDFGKARQVYVALDSPYGQFGIGKQRPVQYLFIAEYVDIFNHSLSPFAYDPQSPFFVNNLGRVDLS